MTMMKNVTVYSSALDMAAAIRNGNITSRQLVELHIARIEALDRPNVNAIVLRDFKAARLQADKADQVLKDEKRKSQVGPFHGVPITLKESIFTPTFKTTMGDPKFWVPSGADCTTAKIMVEVGGAILLGKSNLCLMALDWECNNPVYGETSNPFDLSKSPGGSSGGGAAALAAGFTPLEIGTDLGGSVRIPAAMNGVVGHCATRGIVPNPNPIYNWPCMGNYVTRSLAGMLDDLLWMARAGPLARTVEDVEAMVELLGGDNAAQLPRPKQNTNDDDDGGFCGVRVAVWRSDPICPPGKEVNRAFDKSVAALKAIGAKVEELVPPMDPLETYLIYLRFLGPVTGPHMSQEQRTNVHNKVPKDSYPPEMRSPYWEMDVSGVNGVPEGNQAAYEKAADKWDKFLQDNYDIVLAPVFPTEAWPKASHPGAVLANATTGARKFAVDGDTERCYGDALFWAHLSVLCGFPATSFPVCRTESDGLPVGLQAFGCRGSDFIILDVVRKLMKELRIDHFEPPSNFANVSYYYY